MDAISTTPMTDEERRAMKLLNKYVNDDNDFRRRLARTKLNELLINISDRDLAASEVSHSPETERRPWLRESSLRG